MGTPVITLNAEDWLGLSRELFPPGGIPRFGALRMFGGFACWLHSPNVRHLFGQVRTFDLDLFTPEERFLDLSGKLKELGYRQHKREPFLGGQAVKYLNKRSGAVIDLYVGSLVFCHSVPVSERLESDWPTLPLAELLVTKLQIHDPEVKDLIDILMLVAEHEISASDGEVINTDRLADMCGKDWGLWYDARENLKLATEMCDDSSTLPSNLRECVSTKLAILRSVVDCCPKQLKWRLRACIGTRRCWWNTVEEFR